MGNDCIKKGELEEQIFNALNGLKYGNIQITVHDSKVVQVERTEKFRLDGNPFSRKGGEHQQ